MGTHKTNWDPVDSSPSRPKTKRTPSIEGDVHLALNTLGPSTAVELHTVLADVARDEFTRVPAIRAVRRTLLAMQRRGIVLAVVVQGEAPRWRLRPVSE